MPRAIVMIKPISSKNTVHEEIEKYIIQLSMDEDFLSQTGCIIESFIRSFGWPDFVLSIWGTNAESLKEAILFIRQKSKNEINTSTIFGVTADKMIKYSEESKILDKLINDKKNQKTDDEMKLIISVLLSKKFVESQIQRFKNIDNQLTKYLKKHSAYKYLE